jgi:hypothetical protein
MKSEPCLVHLPSYFDNIRSNRCTGVPVQFVQCHEWQDDKLIANLIAESGLCLQVQHFCMEDLTKAIKSTNVANRQFKILKLALSVYKL